MQRQQVKNVVPSNHLSPALPPSPSKPVPLDRESLKQVVGGVAPTLLPNKGW